MPDMRPDKDRETPADRLLRFFTATEQLLQAAAAVRDASDALVSPAVGNVSEREVSDDA